MNKLRVGSADEAEDADYHVCAKATVKTPYTDNEYGFCCECGEKIQFRPGGPTTPKKICLQCATPGINKSAQDNDLEVQISPEAARLIAKKISEQ